MGKIKVDLHDIFNQGDKIEAALHHAVDEAKENKIKTVEIIHGKGSGQLKKQVLKFLEQPEIKAQYHRIDQDAKNHGDYLYFSNSNDAFVTYYIFS